MNKKRFIKNLLDVLPYWQVNIIRPYGRYLKRNEKRMNLEMYYCLQTVNWFGTLTMSELTEQLNTTKQQATKIVNKLYDYGYIIRLPDEHDRRFIKIAITDDAREDIMQYQCDVGFIAELEDKLNDEELGAFEEALDTLAKIMPKLTQ